MLNTMCTVTSRAWITGLLSRQFCGMLCHCRIEVTLRYCSVACKVMYLNSISKTRCLLPMLLATLVYFMYLFNLFHLKSGCSRDSQIFKYNESIQAMIKYISNVEKDIKCSKCHYSKDVRKVWLLPIGMSIYGRFKCPVFGCTFIVVYSMYYTKYGQALTAHIANQLSSHPSPLERAPRYSRSLAFTALLGLIANTKNKNKKSFCHMPCPTLLWLSTCTWAQQKKKTWSRGESGMQEWKKKSECKGKSTFAWTTRPV
jgi:hypothetical protein